MDKRIDPWEGARSARALAWAIDHPAAPSAKVERSFARAVLISQGERRARGVFAGVALAWALALAEHALRALAMASASKWAQGSRGERSPELSSRERQELQASLGRAGLGRRGSGRPRL